MEKGSSSAIEVVNFDQLVPKEEIPSSQSAVATLSYEITNTEEFALEMIEEYLEKGKKNEHMDIIRTGNSKKIKDADVDVDVDQNIFHENVDVKDVGLLKGWIIKKLPRKEGNVVDVTYFHIQSKYLSFRSLIKVDDFVFHGIHPSRTTKKSIINPEEEKNCSDAKEPIPSNKRTRRKLSTNWIFTEQGNEVTYKGENYKIYDITFLKSSPEGNLVSPQTQRKNKQGRKSLKDKMEMGKDEAGKKETDKMEMGKDVAGKKETDKMESDKDEAGKKETDKMECDKDEAGKKEMEQGGENCNKNEMEKKETEQVEENCDKDETGKKETEQMREITGPKV